MNANENTPPRPAWTYNNVGLFNYWMRTGAAEIPVGWVDLEDETNIIEGGAR